VDPASPERAGRERAFAAVLAIIVAVLALALWPQLRRAFGQRPSKEQCAALLDRYLGLSARERAPAIDERRLDELRREAHRAAPRALAECRDKLTQAQVDCALGSESAEAFERCVQ